MGRRDAAAGLQMQRRRCSARPAPPARPALAASDAPPARVAAAGPRRLLAGVAAALLLAAGASAGSGGGREPLGDLLQIVVTPRALLALDGEGGGDTREDLERGEQVLWTGSRGLVGMALTDRRILAVRTRSAAWQETRWRQGESRPAVAQLGDRVALLATDRRLLGFDGGSGNLAETSVGPQEQVLETHVAANVAVAVTSRRALGISPFVGGFFETPLRVGETVERVDTGSEVATLTTSQRLLIFRGRTGRWSERHLELR